MIMFQQDSVTIVCISDTHSLHRELDMPPAHILIHAGDHAMVDWGRAEILEYDSWLSSLPYKHIVMVPGNHDRWMLDPALRRLITHAIILVDEASETMDLKIWGSGVTPLAGEPFGIGSSAERRKLHESIPDDTNIVVTHTPPYGVMDRAPGSLHHSGCPELREAIERIKPQLHISGHIHGAHGTQSIGGTLFVNAAVLGQGGGIEEKPIVLRMPYAPALL